MMSNENGRKLFLKVGVQSAADLSQVYAMDSARHNSKSINKKCNPIVVLHFSGRKKWTKRRFKTNNPKWDQTFFFRLRRDDYSKVISFVVWDKSNHGKSYLGELRLCAHDIFFSNGRFSPKKSAKWYKMYSSKANQSFVTGSLLLSFDLCVSKSKSRNAPNNNSTNCENTLPEEYLKRYIYRAENFNLPTVNYTNAPVGTEKYMMHKKVAQNESDEEKQITNKLIEKESDIDSEEELVNSAAIDLEAWSKPLVISDKRTMESILLPDEQGFYSDLSSTSEVEISEDESIQSEQSLGDDNDLALERISAQNRELSDKFSVSDSSLSCIDSGEEPISGESGKDIFSENARLKGKRKGLLKLHGKKKSSKQRNFDVSFKDTLGVMFIEIVSCKGLPAYKNFSRTSFDMDPFVVVTFGKKTFRTSWKRHTLNPIFNERIAFEVSGFERNFDLKLFVLDKDKFSFHDQVANTSLKISDLISMFSGGDDSSELTSDDYNTDLYINDSQNGERQGSSTNITVIEGDNLVQSVRKKKFTKRRHVTYSEADTSKFKTIELKLELHKKNDDNAKDDPELKLRVRFEPYDLLRRKFWEILLEQYNVNENGKTYDYIELLSLFDTLGCEASDDLVSKMFEEYKVQPWSGDTLNYDQIIDSLELYVKNERNNNKSKIFELERCPLCYKKHLAKSEDIDIITHVAICASKDWSIVNKLLVSSFVSPQIASRRWFSRVLMKLTYGEYKLGGNSANILVQDRNTGIVMEEKMSAYVRLGIRLFYKRFDTSRSTRIRELLRKLSVSQGIKFDNPQSRNDIKSFVKFHKLDLSECLESDISKYKSFNDFFYRKLKPGARRIESEDPRIIVSPADSRCTAFTNVDFATKFWIKGKNFTLPKLFNGNFSNLENSDLFESQLCSLAIFRLAPQDYHRFHSPVEGTIKKFRFIEGEYYTVNPMAIRSELDVFGQNVRAIVHIDTKEFGPVIIIAVGAMMVGSIVFTVSENDFVKRGDEIGYFKFGGSTVLLLVPRKNFKFDTDLLDNSSSKIETMVRVGQSVGHSIEVNEYPRHHIDFAKQSASYRLNLIRALTGGDVNSGVVSNWEGMHTDIGEISKEMEESNIDETH